jgi:hypothetical protein
MHELLTRRVVELDYQRRERNTLARLLNGSPVSTHADNHAARARRRYRRALRLLNTYEALTRRPLTNP